MTPITSCWQSGSSSPSYSSRRSRLYCGWSSRSAVAASAARPRGPRPAARRVKFEAPI